MHNISLPLQACAFRKLTSLILLFILSANFLQAQKIDPKDVTIIRDKWGVPHIHGKTDADAVYGLVWANAEDDFETMEASILMIRGRYGEVKGKEGAAADFISQFLRAREIAAEQFEEQVSPEFKKILNAYCQAANDWATAHPEDVSLKGVFPISPPDVLGSFILNLSIITGVHFNVQNIIEGNPNGMTFYSLRGSNGFAYNSNKTKDGQVYLANNSHQPLDGPGSWYEVHMTSDEGMNSLGGTFPGGTGVFAGATPNFAWMHTVAYNDYTDTYKLEMHPKEKNKYKFDEEWLELEERTLTLKVKLGGIKIPVKKKVWWSKYGPTLKTKKGVYSLRFGSFMTVKAAEQWWRMNKAQNWREFREALDLKGLTGMNIIYADKEDNIFYLNNGLFPKRAEGYDWLGVVPGNTSKTLWNEFYEVEDLVQVLNPQSGYVYNTNNKPFSSTGPADNPKAEDYDDKMGNFWIDNNRARQFQHLISKYEKVSYQDFKDIKYDQHYPDSVWVYFICNIEDIFHLDENKYPSIAESIKLIKRWDRNSNVDSREAALFMLAYYELFERAQEDFEFPSCIVFPEESFAKAVKKAQKHLKKYFGRIDPELGEVQRLVRGDKDYPIWGMPDVIGTIYSKPWKKGMTKAWLGESYIQLIRFENGEDLPKIESVITYGSSNRQDSPHYDDQVQMFLEQKLKPMSLDMEKARKEAEDTYHPGER